MKSENILLDREGHCRLADYGACVGNVAPGTAVAYGRTGTCPYMAPEASMEGIH